jgi:hypothetical protein
MSISRCLLAVGINCCTMLPAFFLACLLCVGAGFGREDVPAGLARMPPLTTQENWGIIAQAMGIAALVVLPSIVLLSFKKADAALIAACAPLVIAGLMLWFLRRAFM